MRLFDTLSQRKQRGETLDMSAVTYDMLHQLWWIEEIPDVMIADLFGVPKKKVTNLRHKWGIKTPDVIVREFEEKFTGDIPDQTESGEAPDVSAEAAALIRKINHLNDIELEALRVELAHRFPVFSEVQQEVAFLATIERAVQQIYKV
ncbi:hypothetical protein ACOALA_20205 [Alicyclobacillus acidoterrestris]|uniref:hypothetical protein n=1 Tax=Alicyclobacillus acidoterrestris TaxID=1450 RepID=UPI003F52D5E0